MKLFTIINLLFITVLFQACSTGSASVVPANIQVNTSLSAKETSSVLISATEDFTLDDVLIQKGFEVPQFDHHEIFASDIQVQFGNSDLGEEYKVFIVSEDGEVEKLIAEKSIDQKSLTLINTELSQIFEDSYLFNVKVVISNNILKKETELTGTVNINFSSESFSYVFS